ncbi:MAG: MFS transporter [Opitutales bacterium]
MADASEESPSPVGEPRLPWWRAPDFPLDPKQSPIYYGWIVVIVGTLGMLTMVPGSPPGMSPFFEAMMDAWNLSATGIAGAYMLGTLLTGIVTLFSGRSVDNLDARRLALWVLLGYGGLLGLLGVSDRFYRWLAPAGDAPWLALAMLTALFFGIRYLGLGLMATLCRSMVIRWFTDRRNIAITLSGIMLSLSFSSAPVVLFHLNDWLGWRETWLVLGLFFATVIALVAWLFFRSSPEACGIGVDGESREAGVDPNRIVAEKRFPVHHEFTASEAARNYTFWIYILGVSVNGLVGTGLMLNLSTLAQEAGVTPERAFSLLVPEGIISVTFNVVMGLYSGRLNLKIPLLIMLFGVVIEVLGLLWFSTGLGQIAFFVGGGMAWGCFGVLLNMPWPRFFGRRNIGSINGMVTGATIIASAAGPFFFALTFDQLGSYLPILGASLLLPGITALLAIRADNPQERLG